MPDGRAPLRPAGDRAPLAGGVGGRAHLGGRQRRGLRTRAGTPRGTRTCGRAGDQLLRAGDAALPERRAAHRASEVLLGGRRDRPLPPPARAPRAAPDGLRRLRPARREPRDQDRRAPARVSTAESIASFQRQFRSWGISIDWSRELATHEPDLLPLDAVDLPRAVPRGPGLPQGGGGQVVPQRPDGARQRAGRRRRALRALRRARRGAPARAVVPAHHRLRRAAARRPRRDRLARARQDDAAQLDRAQRGRRGDLPLRGARASTTPSSRPGPTRCSAPPSS